MSNFPRALTSVERAALDFLLSADFPGATELRKQAETARVVRVCACGCPSFDVAVDERLAAASLADVVPVKARSASGDMPELLLFARDGRLEGVELVWYGDDPPREFPPLSSFSAPTPQ